MQFYRNAENVELDALVGASKIEQFRNSRNQYSRASVRQKLCFMDSDRIAICERFDDVCSQPL